MCVVFQLVANCYVHINQCSIFKAHALGQTRILIVEVLVPVERHVRKPSNLLSACSTEYLEHLVSYVHIHFKCILSFYHFEFMIN